MAEEKISAEAKKMLLDWQAKGIKFCFDGRVAEISNFSFPAKYYGIVNQALPKAFHSEKGINDLWGVNVRIVNEGGCEYHPWKSAHFDLNRTNIVAQRIPSTVLNMGKEEEEVPKLPDKVAKIMRPKVESDPLGKSANEPGAKLDAGKNRVALVMRGFSRALTEVGRVGTYGANKYSPNGWKEVLNGIERYDDAMMRHWLEGKTIDEETGLLHAAQVAWNALAVLELMLAEKPHV